MFKIYHFYVCLGGHFCLHCDVTKSEVSGEPLVSLPASRLTADSSPARVRLKSDLRKCHAKTENAFCLESDLRK